MDKLYFTDNYNLIDVEEMTRERFGEMCKTFNDICKPDEFSIDENEYTINARLWWD